jgi:hypothetical protein
MSIFRKGRIPRFVGPDVPQIQDSDFKGRRDHWTINSQKHRALWGS